MENLENELVSAGAQFKVIALQADGGGAGADGDGGVAGKQGDGVVHIQRREGGVVIKAHLAGVDVQCAALLAEGKRRRAGAERGSAELIFLEVVDRARLQATAQDAEHVAAGAIAVDADASADEALAAGAASEGKIRQCRGRQCATKLDGVVGSLGRECGWG